MRFSVIRKANNMKDKRILTGQMAYVFTDHGDGIEMTDWQGFTTCKADMFICSNVVENTKSDFLKMLKGECVN